MRKISVSAVFGAAPLLLAAAAGLALTASSARATTIDFSFDTGGGIDVVGQIDETGGVATSGWGTITSPFWIGEQPFVLLPSGNPYGSRLLGSSSATGRI